MKRFLATQLATKAIPIVLFTILFAFVPQVQADFQKTKIAVLDFEQMGDKINTNEIGAILAEWFITSIVKSGRFDVIERAMLQKILSEQQLGITGVIDDTSASKLGRILGVKVIISGSIMKFGDTVEINARVIDVESASIIAAENIRGPATGDLHYLVDQLTDRIMHNFPLTGYIVKKMDDTVVIDLGVVSGLSPGVEFVVFKEGDVIKHPKTGEVLDVQSIPTGTIRITRVGRNVADATILSEEGAGIEYGQQVKSIQTEKEMKAAESASGPQLVAAPEPQAIPASPAQTAAKPEKPPVVNTAPVESIKQAKQKQRFAAAAPPAEAAPPAVDDSDKPEEYKVAILPWVMYRDASYFQRVLVDRIAKRMNKLKKTSVILSASPTPDIEKLESDGASAYWQGSKPDVAKLRELGNRAGFNVAVLGKLNVVCGTSDNCTARNAHIDIVDLHTGRNFEESGGSWSVEAREYINSSVTKVVNQFKAATEQ